MFKIKLADQRERLGRERREKQKGRTVQHHDDTGPGNREVAQIEQRRRESVMAVMELLCAPRGESRLNSLCWSVVFFFFRFGVCMVRI
jgi:hypothetical protein